MYIKIVLYFLLCDIFMKSQESRVNAVVSLQGFLFDEAESRQEEFSFSFGMESPQKSSSTQGTSGPADSFPFSFSFRK